MHHQLCTKFSKYLVLLPTEWSLSNQKLNSVNKLSWYVLCFCFKDEKLRENGDETIEGPSRMISANAIAIAHSLVKTCLSQICKNTFIHHIYLYQAINNPYQVQMRVTDN